MTELLLVTGSGVLLLLTFPMSLITLPVAAVSFTTNETVAVAAFAIVPNAHDTVPVAPTAGEVQLPTEVVALTNVVFAGTASVKVVALAGLGPLFTTLKV